jgi:hypothetical protein
LNILTIKYDYNGPIEEVDLGKACVTYEDKRVFWGKLVERGHFEELDMYGKLLKYILNKRVGYAWN